ncbi:metallophosphoesterase family protein [Fictibacillus fluitans]|uniref:Metallophosphoesterase family protein n=1 Tax=Fictibacillus fluitans TaxID=3058422 RepID=A0ABT8I107_9BACL|nr:metallophosphoesterase family protein [Fictibacillus sp. NE201]MDN4526713.1 metallophosphoesterase family protein [Fictibacillus sp. NE201]
MKIAFISDIHGNAVALETVLQDVKGKSVDQVVVLGDLCFRGPEPKRSLELVQALNTKVIKGNADEWVVRGIGEGEVPSHVMDMMEKERLWCYERLNPEDIAYLQELPSDLTLNSGPIRVHAFHATPDSLFEVVTPAESEPVLKEKMMGKQAEFYVYGHIHKAYVKYLAGKCLANTGSVGLPFDGVPRASYLLLEVNETSYHTSIVRVRYDMEQVIRQYKEHDYPNAEIMINVLKNASI